MNGESLNSSVPKIIESHLQYNDKLKDFITESIFHYNSLTIPELQIKYTLFANAVNKISTTKLKEQVNLSLILPHPSNNKTVTTL